MCKVFLLTILLLISLLGVANNIKISTEAKVTGFTGPARDTAIVEFNLSWDNSWRDDFNWDAAWVFLKYKKRGLTAEWHHAYLAKEGHTATPLAGNEGGEYMFMSGEVGSGAAAKVTGLYLLRDNLGEGKVNAHLTLKWPIQSNSKLSLSARNAVPDKKYFLLSINYGQCKKELSSSFYHLNPQISTSPADYN